MDNPDFVFLANTKSFRRLLSWYGFKFSIFSTSKVKFFKKEIYLRIEDKFFIDKIAYINFVADSYSSFVNRKLDSQSYFTLSVITDYTNRYLFEVDINMLINFKLLQKTYKK